MRNRSKVSKTRVGSGLLLLLLAGCAGDDDAAQSVASTESELAATHASWASARSEAKACFEAFRGCEQSAGRGDASCRDQLKSCLPAQAPVPVACSGADAGEASGHFGGGPGGSGRGRFAGGWDKKGGGGRKDYCDAGIPGGFPGGFPSGTGIPGGTGTPGGTTGATGGTTGGAEGGTTGGPGGTTGGAEGGGTGGPGGMTGGTTPPEPPPVEEPPVEEPPVEEPPVEEPPVVLGLISTGMCDTPPALAPGALSGCGSRAASQLAGGAPTADAANQTLGCIAQGFEQRIAKLCAKASELCASLGAPADTCGRITQACDALGAGN